MMAKVTHIDVERYFDRELSEEKRAEIEAAIAQDTSLKAHLETMTHLQREIKSVVEESTVSVNFDAIWSGIAARIDAETPQPKGFNVRWIWSTFRYPLAAMAMVGIVAMALLWHFRAPLKETLVAGNTCVIERLDVGSKAVGTIFTIADTQSNDETTVIWVSEEMTGDDNANAE